MKQVQFIRPAPYSYKIPSYDLYESYNLVAKGKFQPKPDISKIPVQLKHKASECLMFTSSLPRAVSTAQALNIHHEVVSDLNEIAYCMEQLISHDEFLKYDPLLATKYARQLFFSKIFEGQLGEKKDALCGRVIQILKLISKQSMPVILVSHGFFMKFLEIVVLEPRAISNKEIFLRLYDGTEPSFNFLEGPAFTRCEIEMALNELLIT